MILKIVIEEAFLAIREICLKQHSLIDGMVVHRFDGQ